MIKGGNIDARFKKSVALCVIYNFFCINGPFVSLNTQSHGDERMMDGNR